MRTAQINVFSFEELSEQAQQKAIEKFSDINVEHDWHEWAYEDAKNVGIKINGFDTYRKHIDGELLRSASTIIANIMSEHGETSDTYQTAKQYREDFSALYDELDTAQKNEDKDEEEQDDTLRSAYDVENDIEELEEDFRKSILEDYLSILSREFDYQTSEEAIIETIIANEYEFTEDGKLFTL